MNALLWSSFTTSLGRWSVAATDSGLCAVVLDPSRAQPVLESWLARWEQQAELVALPELGTRTLELERRWLNQGVRELQEYAGGLRQSFEVTLDQRGTAFELRAYQAMCAIPYGETRSYGQLARDLGGETTAARAVGRACGSNPLPVIVPCHRVLAADGLGGFTGGLVHKRRLLALEGHAVQAELDF